MTAAGAVLLVLIFAGAGVVRATPHGDRTVAGRLLWGAPARASIAGRPVSGMTFEEVESLVWSLQGTLRLPPKNASIDRRSGRIEPGRDGATLDVELTRAAVMGAGEGETVMPRTTRVRPRISAEDVPRLTRPLGSYATTVAGSPERRENIRLATRNLDRSLIAPGEIFSFLETLGPTTHERGFVDAPVIVGEEFVPGPGGGVCQVATTIYNAALESGLAVVERHRHTKPVSYVPEGMDAVVASWGLDLKILNPTDHPVMLRVSLDGRRLMARFLGP
ncbi:MAG: VanW family protein [Firmicutes bacterium]|jgi:vancomycin resistance protein YoaR|nr:VanW family protein [Bacillota bacterium]